jgi:hypothetical protein
VSAQAGEDFVAFGGVHGDIKSIFPAFYRAFHALR